MKNLKAVLLMTVVALPLYVPQVRAQQRRRPFNFARAERIADQMLRRKPAPLKKRLPTARPKQPVCPICKGTLIFECPRHRHNAPCLIEGRPAAKICPWCKETGFLPCPRCRYKKELKQQLEAVLKKQKKAHELAKAVLEEINAWEAPDKLGFKLTGYAAPHFSIASNLPESLVVGCVNRGAALLKKLENEFHAKCFACGTPADTRFFLMKTSKDYARALQVVWRARFPDSDLKLALKGSGVHSHALPSLAVNCFARMAGKQSLEHNFVHVLGHFLINRVDVERDAPPWIEEGFAAYCETLELRSPRVYCFAYDFNKQDIVRNRDRTLREMARKNKPVPMERLTQMTYMDMKPPEYFQAWSLVTMLIERDPNKFRAFLKALPKPEIAEEGALIPADKQEEALKAVYGYDYPKLLAVWRQYALARR